LWPDLPPGGRICADFAALGLVSRRTRRDKSDSAPIFGLGLGLPPHPLKIPPRRLDYLLENSKSRDKSTFEHLNPLKTL
jgi:hypothetical protein